MPAVNIPLKTFSSDDVDKDGVNDRIEYENKHMLSVSFMRMSSIFALVLIIFSNFIGDLFNGTIKSILRKYHFKHVIAILVLYFFVMIVDASYTVYSYPTQLLYLVSLYCVFLIFTRCEGRFAMLCLGILLVLYSIHSWINNLYLRNKRILTTNDFTTLRTVEKILGASFCVFLFIGFMIYVGHIKDKCGNKMRFYKLYVDATHKSDTIPFEKLFDFFLLGVNTSVGRWVRNRNPIRFEIISYRKSKYKKSIHIYI
jgi:hypothetical protein